MDQKTTSNKSIEENVISLETAQEWAARWRMNPENTVKAHLIPRVDINELLAEKYVVDVRAYIGVDDDGVNKLMLVGVDADGKDLINDSNQQYIYDFTQPCPNTCDVDSPLYTLKP
ncbi:hypothetical protein [Flavobacterium humi]|uniref:Uncharacterized protein n=1 Tax=Flavobacterium humi TaxID=2562683 RepID=A0A4Z0L351_9FLAO|nr:hypothetical protein [Flavobacterium humi]TGD56650.1 hypothetical protein E4635_14485 [Flavobacterium humi]